MDCCLGEPLLDSSIEVLFIWALGGEGEMDRGPFVIIDCVMPGEVEILVWICRVCGG